MTSQSKVMAAFCSQSTVSDHSLEIETRCDVSNSRVGTTYDSRFVLHSLETLLPLLELKSLVDDTLDLDLAAIEIVDCGREFVCFAKGADDGDFIADWKNKKKSRVISDKQLVRRSFGHLQIFEGGHDTRSLLPYTP